jgi:hypothetical protein
MKQTITYPWDRPKEPKMAGDKKPISLKIEWPPLWAFFWLGTIGLCDLSFQQGCWAVIIWPYYLGDLVRTLWLPH